MTRWITSPLVCWMFFFQSLAFSISQAAPALIPTPESSSSKIPLSSQDVADLILKQSYEAQEINIESEQARLPLLTVEQLFDFQLSADSGYQESRFVSSTQSYLTENKSWISNVQLAKPFITGTLLTLQYTSTSDQPTYSNGAPTTAQDNTNSSVGLILEQNLWRNFFGVANRADLRSAESTLKAAKISRLDQLQDLVLRGIQAFWSTYVAQETYQEAVSSRDRYLKLVSSVQKKTGYGYSSPGELSQARAELENKEQTVKSTFVSYKAELDQLVTLLHLPPESEITFLIPENLPAPPATQAIDIEKLRPHRASALNLEAAEETLRSTKSKAYPDLSLVGKYYTQGYEERASDATRELSSGTHPRYYVGFKVQYNFGSNYQAESILNKRLARDLADAQMQRQKLELQDQGNDIRRRLQSTYAIVESARNQKNLREKAIQELTRSYNQGRTDIAILIDAMNKYFDSEVQLTRAVGNYQIALTEWAAFQDELIQETR